MSEPLTKKYYWVIKSKLQQMFSCELLQVFKNTYFEDLLQVAVINDSK